MRGPAGEAAALARFLADALLAACCGELALAELQGVDQPALAALPVIAAAASTWPGGVLVPAEGWPAVECVHAHGAVPDQLWAQLLQQPLETLLQSSTQQLAAAGVEAAPQLLRVALQQLDSSVGGGAAGVPPAAAHGLLPALLAVLADEALAAAADGHAANRLAQLCSAVEVAAAVGGWQAAVQHILPVLLQQLQLGRACPDAAVPLLQLAGSVVCRALKASSGCEGALSCSQMAALAAERLLGACCSAASATEPGEHWASTLQARAAACGVVGDIMAAMAGSSCGSGGPDLQDLLQQADQLRSTDVRAWRALRLASAPASAEAE